MSTLGKGSMSTKLFLLASLFMVLQTSLSSGQPLGPPHETQLQGSFDCSDASRHLVLKIELPTVSSQDYSYEFSWDQTGDGVFEAVFTASGRYIVSQTGRIPERNFQFPRAYGFGWDFDRSQYVAGYSVQLIQLVSLDGNGVEHSIEVQANISGVTHDGGHWGMRRLLCSQAVPF